MYSIKYSIEECASPILAFQEFVAICFNKLGDRVHRFNHSICTLQIGMMCSVFEFGETLEYIGIDQDRSG